MEQYISKSALVTELNRLIAELVEEGKDTMFEQGRISAFEDVKVFINHTLEVKEEPVSNDLEREIKHYVYDPYFDLNGVAVKGATDYLTVEDVADIARHFAQWQKKQEAKKVDIEKEFDDYTKDILACDIQFEPFTHLHNCAKHFFELGLKAKGK